MKRARAGLIVAALAAVAIAFFIARPPPTTGPALRDFESYYAAGETWHYEGDPYSRDVWRTEKDVPGVIRTRDELLPFVGPPFGLPLWSVFSRLPWSNAVLLWEAVLGVSLGAIALASLRLARGRIGALDVLAVLLVAAGFGPLTSGVALGQVAIVACAAIALVPFTLRPRWLGATFCAALVAALQPNLALVLAARLGSRRTWLAFTCAAIFAIGGSALALGGPAGFAHYLDVLRAHGVAERFIAIQTTPAAVARALGASATVAGFVALGLAAFVIAVIAAQCLSGRYVPDARLALASAALPLAIPFAHEHDFAIVFLPAIVTIRSARGATWLVGACGTLLAGTDWLGLAQRSNGIAETALLTLAAAFGIAALSRGTFRPLHIFPALVTLAVVIAGAVVATHPLPTWPDALGLRFHVPYTLQAPEVWRREQVAAGIAALQPAWGWLRLLSLTGCALVWGAASIALRETKADVKRRTQATHSL